MELQVLAMSKKASAQRLEALIASENAVGRPKKSDSFPRFKNIEILDLRNIDWWDHLSHGKPLPLLSPDLLVCNHSKALPVRLHGSAVQFPRDMVAAFLRETAFFSVSRRLRFSF